MAKTTAHKRRVRKRPDALTIATALERARLKRLVIAKRDIARLVNEFRRATDRADEMLSDFAKGVCESFGHTVTYTDKTDAGTGTGGA